jgi:DNA-binding XRE family transcriptional regulator
MNQQTFLRVAKRELGLSYPELALAIGVSPRTIEKWSLHGLSQDFRMMPLMAVKFISRLLEDKKRIQVLAGDRETAETIDALASHVDREKYLDSLRTFDSLQRSANAMLRMRVVPNKPGFFKTQEEKNTWSEQEEIRNARQSGKARAIAR